MRSLCVFTAAAMAVCVACRVSAAVIEEDFTTDPLLRGWKIHGAAHLFNWDQPSGAVQVTWDSSLTNSYFYRPLGPVLTKADEFSLSFDLRLDEVTLGTFELAVGLLRFSDATRPGFLRGTGSDSPNLVEFDYFPDWSSVDATTSDASGAMQFNYDFPITLNLATTYHIVLKHTAGAGMLTGEIYLDGVLYSGLSKTYPNTNFTDFQVDTLAISSYSGANSFSDLNARGVVDNLVLDMPFMVGSIGGGFAGAPWEVRVSSSTNCTYSLQRTTDLKGWSDVGVGVRGTGHELILIDPNPAASGALYRVKAAW
jgi:hypothetical protein